MRLLEHAPGQIDDAMLTEIGATLKRLRFRSFPNGVNATQLLADIREEGMKPDYAVTNDNRNVTDRGVMLSAIRGWPICESLPVQ